MLPFDRDTSKLEEWAFDLARVAQLARLARPHGKTKIENK